MYVRDQMGKGGERELDHQLIVVVVVAVSSSSSSFNAHTCVCKVDN